MSFKEDIEQMCARAVRNNEEITVRLPRPPLSWSKDQSDERFLQLYYLCQLNGCEIIKKNIKDYKIRKLTSKSVMLKPRKKSSDTE